jgi:drug/metabolite transporter (DMT)-like permease
VPRTRRYGWEIGLVAVAAVWGATFPLVKCSIERCAHIKGGLGLAHVGHPIPPLEYLAIRFAIATVLVTIFAIPALRGLTRRQLWYGVAIGLALTGGYMFQTFGLQRTSAAHAGFITGLYVILTPLFGAIFLRKKAPVSTAAGALIAVVGLALLTVPAELGVRTGDALVLGCAVMFAVQILLVGAFARAAPVLALTVVQLAVVAVISEAASLVAEHPVAPTDSGVWISIAITAVLASAVGLFLVTGAQRFIPPARAAVIYTMESPFAALFGFAMLGERLGVRGWSGAALIFGGMLVAELFAPASESL